MTRKARVPKEVVARAGSIIKREDLERWWLEGHALLGGKSLRGLWVDGRQDEVISFIDAVKSGGVV